MHAGGSHGSPRSVHLCLQRGSWILCVGDRNIGFAPRASAMRPLRASRLFPLFVSARAVSSVFARRGFAPPRAVPSLSTCVIQPYVCEIMSECFARRKQRSPWNYICHTRHPRLVQLVLLSCVAIGGTSALKKALYKFRAAETWAKLGGSGAAVR